MIDSLTQEERGKPDESTWKRELDKLERFKETHFKESSDMAKKKPTAVANAVLDVPVNFGNFSSGDKVCRIGLTVPRDNLPLSKADKVLCDQRLTGQFFPKMAGENMDQATLDGMDEEPVSVVFDVKGFRVNSDDIAFGATMMKQSTDRDAVMNLAQRAGRLVVTETEAVTSGAPEEGDGEEGDEDGDGEE